MHGQYIRSILDSLLVKMTRLWRGGLTAETESDRTAAPEHTLQTTCYVTNILHTKTDMPTI